jgi:site-specific DNA-cytosine methylase
VFGDKLGCDVKFQHTFVAELDPDLRSFLLENFPDIPHVLGKVATVAEARAYDYKTQSFVTVPWVELLIFGAVCKARSSNNKNAKQNKNCIQNGTCDTGESFEEAEAVIDALIPDMILMENVKNLTQKGDDDPSVFEKFEDHLHLAVKSDAEYIIQRLASKGYWARDVILDARKVGSLTVRIRWYCLAVKEITPPRLYTVKMSATDSSRSSSPRCTRSAMKSTTISWHFLQMTYPNQRTKEFRSRYLDNHPRKHD